MVMKTSVLLSAYTDAVDARPATQGVRTDWWTLCIVPLMSKRTECIVDNGGATPPHGFVKGEAMALAWALLPNKTRAAYSEMFAAIRDNLLALLGSVGAGERTFVTDFETAAIQAIRSVFPGARMKGCSFHFRLAICRRIQQEGLTAHYEDEQSPLRTLDAAADGDDGVADVRGSARLGLDEGAFFRRPAH